MNEIRLVKNAYLHLNKGNITLIGIYWNNDLPLVVGDIVEDAAKNKYSIIGINFHNRVLPTKVSLYVDNAVKPVGEFLYKIYNKDK